ncbi:MAG TPA: hypothetical protein PKZ76_03495 [Xanthomonadaceae bacterium]|nr:hypothetical protein [Xanthomonadaceae bacterium]
MTVEQVIEALFSMPDMSTPAVLMVDGELREIRSVLFTGFEPLQAGDGREIAVLRVERI